MYYLITIEAGHGMNTAGKRTPTFPEGGIMKENEFNEGAVRYFKEIFKYTPNVEIFDVATEIEDTPLATRVSRANARLADVTVKYGKANVKSVHVSIHANAYLAKWGTWGGQGVFYNTGSVEGKKLAEMVLGTLKEGTILRDRGADPANFYMVKYTIAPSVLVESAFMDNLEEARLLQTEAFRKETGEDIARGVAKYMGIAIVPKPVEITTPAKETPSIIGIKPLSGFATVIYDGADGLNVRKDPSIGDNIETVVHKGDVFTIVAITDNGFYKLKSGLFISANAKYVLFKEPVVFVPKVFGTVNATLGLNVRSDAGTKFGKISKLKNGITVEVIGEKSGWYKIVWGANQGWVSKDYIKLK